MRKVQQRGLPRSGTTMCGKMVEDGWGYNHLVGRRGKRGRTTKHRTVQDSRDWPLNTVLLINLKDPYAWIVSWHAWAVQAGHQGTKIPDTKIPFSYGPAKLGYRIGQYNNFYRAWFKTKYDKAIVRYEDVLESLDALYAPMTELLGPPKKRWDALPETIVRPGSTPGGMPQYKFKRQYYTEKQYLELLKPEHIRQITDQIDWKLFEGLYVPEG